MDSSEYTTKLTSKRHVPKNAALNQQELKFLDLFAKNFPDQGICEELSLTPNQLTVLKESIKRKTKMTSWLEVMSYCFEAKILDKNDYISSCVNQNAVKYASRLLERLDSSNQANKVYDLQELLSEFYESCLDYNQNRFGTNQLEVLSATEKAYLHLKFRGYTETEILNKLKVLPKLVFIINRQLLQKLDSNSLYNAFRKGIELRLLGRSHSDMQKTIAFKKRLIYTHKICKCFLQEEKSSGLKNSIKEMLVSFYAEMHYTALFSQLENKKYKAEFI